MTAWHLMTAHRAGVNTLSYATVHGVTQQRNNSGPRDIHTWWDCAMRASFYKEQVTRSRHTTTPAVKEKEGGCAVLQGDAEGGGQASHRRTYLTARRQGFLPVRAHAPYSVLGVPHHHHLWDAKGKGIRRRSDIRCVMIRRVVLFQRHIVNGVTDCTNHITPPEPRVEG